MEAAFGPLMLDKHQGQTIVEVIFMCKEKAMYLVMRRIGEDVGKSRLERGSKHGIVCCSTRPIPIHFDRVVDSETVQSTTFPSDDLILQ